ncbi:MAG: DGQHR domain-containing protein [Candidatus Omnitrophica bacterium]|nr:DGQHR domain-containing protein [Candidatus Omnitrophota bacterium]
MKIGEKFEEEIRNFLKTTGFENVNGGRNFKIGDVQIDAIGGFGENVFIIECFASSRKKEGVRKKLKEFKGVIQTIRNDIKKHPIYGRYSNQIFALALKNIFPSDSDIKFSNQKPPVIIWDPDFIEYYEKMSEAVGSYTIYNILGELGIQPTIEYELLVPALKTKLGGFNVYSFWIDPKRLLKYAFVARRERKEENYYQRFISKQRIKEMAEDYIDKGKFYPNSIIVSIEEECKFKSFPQWKSEVDVNLKDIEFGILQLPNKYRNCWIIDGQHRLYSFSKSERQHMIPVIAFEKINKIKQAEIFVDVNLNQKVVPPDLLWDLIGELSPTSEKGIISNVVKELNKKSCLREKFYIPSFGFKRKGQLKFSGMCQAIYNSKLCKKELPTRKINPLYDDNPEKFKKKLTKVLNEYFSYLSRLFTEEYKRGFIFTNGGIAVMIYYLERIFRYLGKIPNKKNFEKFLNPLQEYLQENYSDKKALESLRLSCNSEGGRKNKTNEFVVYVAQIINEKEFAMGIPTPLEELQTKIEEVEFYLREFIKAELEKKSKNWEALYIPQDIFIKLQNRLRNKSPYDKRTEKWQFLTLGECRIIIDKNWEEFESIFNTRFDSKNEVLVALDKLNKIRSPQSHAQKAHLKLPKNEEEIIKNFIEKIFECIKK